MKNIILFVSFLASIVCQSQTQIDFTPGNTGQTFNTCNGFIIDSGGQGGPGYSDNETSTITICSGTPGETVSITFNLFSLSTVDDDFSNNTNVDYMYVYDGNSTSAPLVGVYSGNQLQGDVIIPSVTNTSGCITLTFTSNTSGTGNFTASASCDIPCSNPVAQGEIVGGITSDSIRVCLGEEVQFQNTGSYAQPGFNISSYLWNFNDNTTANTANASHSFAEPGVYRVQLIVTDDNPDITCTNTNLLDLKVLVAPAPDFTGFPDDTVLCIGESVSFTANPNDYETIWDGFDHMQEITDGCIEDSELGVSQDINLLVTSFISGSVITSVNDIISFCFEMEHTYIGDLVINLTCPNGQSTILHQQGGGGTYLGVPVEADGIDCNDPSTVGTPYTYCFTPVATQTWEEWVSSGGGSTVPAGDYEPVQSFSNLIGCPANGTWKLSVIDNWAADDGAVFSFSLTLADPFNPPADTLKPQIGLGVDSSYWHNDGQFISNISSDGDVITITPTTAGNFNYVYSVIDDFGCQHDTSVNVTVNPDPSVFAGNDTTVCVGAGLQLDGQVTNTQPAYTYAYSWSPSVSVSDPSILDPTIVTEMNQTYVLSVSPVGHPNCVVTDDIVVNFYTPDADLGADQSICEGTSIILDDKLSSATQGLTFLWSTNATTETISVSTAGTYWVEAGVGSCTASDTINISVLPLSQLSAIPNVITPNKDGINDQLSFTLLNSESFSLKILNRWNNLIYETNSTTQFWDGTVNGSKVSDGVYFYVLTYVDTCKSEDPIQLNGMVTVIGD